MSTLRSTISVERRTDDVEKPRYSHSEWNPASPVTKKALDIEVKASSVKLFSRSAVYDFIYDNEGKFSASRMCLLFDIPSHKMV